MEMEVGRGVMRQVMGWFGEFGSEVSSEKSDGEDTWRMDQTAVVSQIGLGHLMPYKVRRSTACTPHTVPWVGLRYENSDSLCPIIRTTLCLLLIY